MFVCNDRTDATSLILAKVTDDVLPGGYVEISERFATKIEKRFETRNLSFVKNSA